MLSKIILHGDSVWLETWIPGESWLADKTQKELLGFVTDGITLGRFSVVENNEGWNKETEEVEEHNIIISTHETKENAVESMKEYFGIN